MNRPGESGKSFFTRFRGSVRNRIVAGLLIFIPIVVTYLLLKLLYTVSAGLFTPLVRFLAPSQPKVVLALISLFLLAAILYLAGLIAAHLVGRRVIAWGESLVARIPLVKTIYSSVKQAVDAISSSNRIAFKKVVLVQYPRLGIRALGFVSRITQDREGKIFYLIFVPTSPNPTTGFLQIVPCDEVEETSISVEEAVQTIVSGGIIAADILNAAPSVPRDAANL
ncbi:MAG: DUF502 domain-containing protein [Planctomycetota bacterium]